MQITQASYSTPGRVSEKSIIMHSRLFELKSVAILFTLYDLKQLRTVYQHHCVIVNVLQTEGLIYLAWTIFSGAFIWVR